MNFLDRRDEIRRLDAGRQRPGAFAVIWGRRRVGKSRLLIEWCRRHRGLYTVADQFAQSVQRRYLATALADTPCETRLRYWYRHRPCLEASAWEELCRMVVDSRLLPVTVQQLTIQRIERRRLVLDPKPFLYMAPGCRRPLPVGIGRCKHRTHDRAHPVHVAGRD